MIKKIIEISKGQTYLCIRNDQLLVKQDAQDERSIPCEDIGVLIVDHPRTQYTHTVFTKLLEFGAAVVLCGPDHHPSGMFLPVDSNNLQAERYRYQIDAKEPLKKNLWKQIVQAKIKHQAKVVKDYPKAYAALKAMATKVRSGDPDNIEAQASRKYWQVLFEDAAFRRGRDGGPPNNMLNYGYMVIRAAIARALCSSGLLPSLGIHHRNRYNAFCLADDIVEPFRGFVDSKVRDIWQSNADVEELTQEIKAQILEILYDNITISGFNGPLLVGMHRTTASLQRCFAGEQKKIELPEI